MMFSSRCSFYGYPTPMFCEGWSLNPYLSSPTLATGLGYNWGNSTPVDPSSISDSRSGSVAIVGKSGFLHSLHGAPHLHHPRPR